jgi:uncharacterized protein (TIGR02594 family)
MDFKFALAVGCASLLALSIPASGNPLPRRADQRARPHHAAHRMPAKPVQPRGNANLALRARMQANRAVPVTASHAFAASEPIFGWPSLVSEARKYIGTNPTARKKLWCATFMNFVLAKAGYAGTNSDAAKSFAYYGHRISEPTVGAIAVLSRGKRGGHVGVVSGIDSQGNPIIISGNHNKRVGEGVYPRARVIAYVMPSGHGPLIQVAERGTAGPTAPSGPSIDSPIAELLAAINAEQERSQVRTEARNQPARPPEPPAPHRTVQQLPDQAPGLEPWLADMLGMSDHAPAARTPRPAPQRQQRVEVRGGARLASADARR